MIINFKKEYTINSDPEGVWNFLTDLQKVTTCMPNLENLEIQSPTKFRAKVKPPFSFVKGKLRMESELKEFNEKESLTIAVKGSSIGASFEVAMNINLTPMKGTKIQIDVRLETFGLLKTLPKSLIHKVVEDIESSMLACIKQKLE